MIYLVTGCLGFIGRAYTENMLIRGQYVLGIDNETYAANPELINYWQDTYPGRFHYIKHDIAILPSLPDVDYIVNFAAETHVDNSIADVDLFLKSNYLGVYNLLELIKVKRSQDRPLLLHISTDEVYGDTINHTAPTETSPLRPSNPYAATKAAADLLIESYARTYGIRYKIVRPSNCWGEGQYHEKLIPKFIRHMRLGRKMPIHGDGNQHRSWLHVSDAVRAINTVIQKGDDNSIYNIGGVSMSILDIIRMAWNCNLSAFAHGPLKDNVVFGAERPGMDLWYGVDDTKLRQLGWTPTVNTIDSMDNAMWKAVGYYTRLPIQL
jgi:dTDP-glucose 4,6-dehydratase